MSYKRLGVAGIAAALFENTDEIGETTMATQQTKRVMAVLGAVVSVALFFPARALAQNPTAEFIGTDGNWFNAANWSTGRVPDAGTDVVLDGTDAVVINPSRGSARVEIRDLRLRGAARLVTEPGTILMTRDELIEESGVVEYRSSESHGENMIIAAASDPAACPNCGGVKLNPTPHTKRTIVLQSSFVEFGLGGLTPASPGNTGAGFYATLTADIVVLDGDLRLRNFYGFRPQIGDTFQIITAGRILTGRFRNLREGALVARDGPVGLYISYVGGDGNDVVLTAALSAAPR